MESTKQERLEELREKIRAACLASGRNESDVTLIAVSKTKPWEDVRDFVSLGVRTFGENYVQEAIEKQRAAAQDGVEGIEWHMIGTLQSNKAKLIPGNFHIFHALDSLSLAQKLDKAAAAAGMKQRCLLEVNVDQEDSKGGLAESAVARLLEQLSQLKHIHITGLMCIPATGVSRDPRAPFAALRLMRDKLNNSSAYSSNLADLSMGMSNDFEAAIREGATFVRVGTVLFGGRTR